MVWLDPTADSSGPAAPLDEAEPAYRLRLYVAGMTERSGQAIENARRLCDEHLAGRHRLEVVDIRSQPAAAIEAQVVAAPTLVKLSPLPVRRLIGDFSRTDRVLKGLGIVTGHA